MKTFVLVAAACLLACAHHSAGYNPAAAEAEDKVRLYETDAAATTNEDRKPTAAAPPVAAARTSALVADAGEKGSSAELDVGRALDDFHAAAAAADEARYFAHFTRDAIFLGTDATERWTLAAFRAFAHPFFARGKAWSFTPVRRSVTVIDGGSAAFFDEDLATPNLGPARGTGVLQREGGAWKIAQYNLAITVPNDKMRFVRELLERPASGPAK
jgi:ketosteroid isomerase-like protein